ncbi:MAG: HAD family hydrolase [Planctomycetota bacterium]|nr:HAD family hydrolase [Planctomycetota bacterium]MDA1261722.1 HAD family hydrolase [Planctomycetota bacterium]
MKSGVFLDRDNTILANDGDLGDPELVRILPGVAWGIRALREAGYCVVVVTNQGGVARGLYSEEDVDAVHARCEELLMREAGWSRSEPLIVKWMYCPFHPNGTVAKYRAEHPWRKPAPGMLIAAADELSIDCTKSWMIGDQERDIEAGRAARCRTILITPPSHAVAETRATSAADFVEVDLLHASHRILRMDGRDGAPMWAQTSSAKLLALSGRLADAHTRNMIQAAAHALAEREGIRLVRVKVDQTGVDLEIVGSEIVVLGFTAELRRNTNHWANSHGALPIWVNG